LSSSQNILEGNMTKRKPATKEENAKKALRDATVRLVYDMYHKLTDVVEQMQGIDEVTDENEEEMAELHEAEKSLLGRAEA